MTIPIGWGRNRLLGRATPMSQPRKYINARLRTGMRCRVKKIRTQAAKLLLMKWFFGWLRLMVDRQRLGCSTNMWYKSRGKKGYGVRPSSDAAGQGVRQV